MHDLVVVRRKGHKYWSASQNRRFGGLVAYLGAISWKTRRISSKQTNDIYDSIGGKEIEGLDQTKSEARFIRAIPSTEA